MYPCGVKQNEEQSVRKGRNVLTYLTLGTLFATGGVVYASLGGKKESVSSGKPLAERVKEAVPIKAGSRCVCPCFHIYADLD